MYEDVHNKVFATAKNWGKKSTPSQKGKYIAEHQYDRMLYIC